MNGKPITSVGAIGIHQATMLNPAIQGNTDLYFRGFDQTFSDHWNVNEGTREFTQCLRWPLPKPVSNTLLVPTPDRCTTPTFVLVSIYEEAIDFYVGRLGFELWEDARLTAEKR